MSGSLSSNQKFGILCSIAAQFIWGTFPLYINVLKRKVDAVDFVAHRAIWSFVLLVACVALVTRVNLPVLPRLAEIKSALGNRQSVKRFLLASVLILINWIAFVWAATHDQVLDASLGYYICPQVAVLLGVIFLGERLSPPQWLGLLLTVIGVCFVLRSTAGMPWISLILAVSFGFYGLVKKQTTISPLAGLTFETGILFAPAVLYLGWKSANTGTLPMTDSWWMNVMLLGSGLVTLAPLALYAAAVKYIRLSTAGFLQFIGPTLQFFVGVFLLGESFDYSRMIAFCFVWAGVILYLVSLRGRSKSEPADAAPVNLQPQEDFKQSN